MLWDMEGKEVGKEWIINKTNHTRIIGAQTAITTPILFFAANENSTSYCVLFKQQIFKY